jgi:hypothetical protein
MWGHSITYEYNLPRYHEVKLYGFMNTLHDFEYADQPTFGFFGSVFIIKLEAL